MLTQAEVREKLIDRTGRETQTSVAQKIGVPKQLLSNFIHGRTELWDETLIVLNDYLENTMKKEN